MSAVQSHIRQTTTATFPLPPAVPPVTAPPIPTVIDTDPAEAGAAFGRRGSRQPPTSGDSSIGLVSINGRSYTGPVFDTNRNRIA